MIRAKVLGRKYSKMLCTTRLEGYFLWRLPCQDSVKVKWSKDPGICFGKAIYRLHLYRRNPWDETRTDSKQTKTYNLGQNLLRHITKIPIFCTYPGKNDYSRKLKDRFPLGVERGGEFVPFGHDGWMAQNWKLHWNASTLLSEVVDFFVVVLKRAVFNGSTKSSFKIFLNFTNEEEITVSLIRFWFY